MYFMYFYFIKSSACSSTVTNTTCYYNLTFLLLVINGKMVEVTDQRRDCALEDIVNAKKQSKHVKCELKKSIIEAVITLATIFHALKKDTVDKSAKNIEPQTEVNQASRELQAYRDTRVTTAAAPSIASMKTLGTSYACYTPPI